MAIRRARRWIYGMSGKTKYAVNNLIEASHEYCPVRQIVTVFAKTRVGYNIIGLKQFVASSPALRKAAEKEATKFINETFPSG